MCDDTRYAACSGRSGGITIATYNIRHGRGLDDRVDLKRIGEVLKAVDADVIAVQEIESRSPRSSMIDEPALLAESLGMSVYFAPNWGVGPIGKFGNAIFSRLPLYSTWNKHLTSRGERRGLAHALVHAGEREMHIYCTHWGLNADERLVQAQECFGRLTRDAGDLSVICGDLNAEAPSPEVRRLVDSTGWSLADPSEASFPADLHRVRIDHIIVNSGVEIDSVTVIASGASDHFCVVARLAWTV